MAAYGYFDHNDPAPPIARDPFTRMLNCGYSSGGSLGENIAAGQPTPSDVMTAWLNSPGHRANIEAARVPLDRASASRSAARTAIYWTQEFASGTGTGTPPPAPPARSAGASAAPGIASAAPGFSACRPPRRLRRRPRRHGLRHRLRRAPCCRRTAVRRRGTSTRRRRPRTARRSARPSRHLPMS